MVNFYHQGHPQKTFEVGSLEQALVPLYQGIIPIVMPIAYDTKTTKQTFASAQEITYFSTGALSDLSPGTLSIERLSLLIPLEAFPFH